MIVLRDRRGRVWARRLDVAAAVRMREIAGLDVMAIALEGGDLNDMPSVVDALYAVMMPDLGSVKPWRFGRRLRAMPADELRMAIADGVADFVRLPGPARPERKHDGKTSTPEELWRDLWRMGGAVGVDPGPLTFGEIATMAEGRRRDEWSRSASLMEAIYNSAFGSDGTAKAEDIDPTGGLKEASHGQGQSQELNADNLRAFAAMVGAR